MQRTFCDLAGQEIVGPDAGAGPLLAQAAGPAGEPIIVRIEALPREDGRRWNLSVASLKRIIADAALEDPALVTPIRGGDVMIRGEAVAVGNPDRSSSARKALPLLALLALALGACSDGSQHRPDSIVAPAALDLTASNVESLDAWECVISAYPDTAAMGSAWDDCVGPRGASSPPPPPGPGMVYMVGYSTAGQILHQVDLELNPGLSAMDLVAPAPWGYGDCLSTPAGYVPSGIFPPGPHVFAFNRTEPACEGGIGRGVVRVWGDPSWAANGVSYTALWTHLDTMAALHGPPAAIWWWIADHKSVPGSTAHVDRVYAELRARWPTVPIVVNDVTQQLPPGTCAILGSGAYQRSQELAAYALTLPGTAPGPTLTPIDPAGLGDGCHYSATGLEQGPQGAEAIAWWGSQ